MTGKKQGPTHSQTLGIVWLSAGLLLIAALAFFLPKRGAEQSATDSTAVQNEQILASKEDSVYRQRRKNTYKTHDNSHIEHQNSPSATGLYTTTPPSPTRQPLVVELNSADTLTLQLLHGIGPVFARRIVGYRDRLGGYTSTTQLLEVYGFTPELLAHIGPSLTLDTTLIRRLAVNTADLKQLARHPYMEYYQARDIVRLRQSGVRFRTADDLRAVPSMADSSLQRLLPYISFSDTTDR